MFKCCSCKNEYAGTPDMTNACGDFCVECHEQKKMKQRNSTKYSDCCRWCGDYLTNRNTSMKRLKRGENTYVCKRCEHMRDQWLLKCIRHSDKAFRYVKSREEKYKDERKRPQRQTSIVTDNARLDRMELILERLVSELGID